MDARMKKNGKKDVFTNKLLGIKMKCLYSILITM